MKCHKVKVMLMTDYADGQISDKKKKSVEQHLAQCLSCRKLAEQIKSVAVRPFEGLEPEEVPADMLANIWESVDAGKAGILAPFEDFLRRLKSADFLKPAMGFALTLVVGFMIWGAIVRPGRFFQSAQLEEGEQTEYFAYLAEYMGAGGTEETNGYGTVFEEIFYH